MSTTRREFLRAGALAGTGLVLAFHLPRAAARAAAGELEPNAWLRVAPSGEVTVLIGRSELGQGVRTSLPMLVAEELDADWTKVRFEQAIPAPKYGDMTTGGSRSIVEGWEPLRTAGAQARAMLVAAAAKRWKVEPAACRTERGEVIHDASGRRLGYGALATEAAALPVPEKPPLKDPKAFRLIGTSPARLDLPDKISGRAVYGLDVRVPGMQVAVVARCPVFGGKLRRFDAAPALAVPGVKQVVPIAGGVAVVAADTWSAMRGREALKVEWEEGALATLDDAAITKRYAAVAAKGGPVVRKEGDGAAALARAARIVEAVYETPYLAHATLEPMNCVADVKDGRCTLWMGSQSATGAQEAAAKLLGLPKEAVLVHLQYSGGGFGRRGEDDFVLEAVELSKAVGTPVQVVWTREDDMRHDWYRPATYHTLRAGVDGAGAPLAWSHVLVGPAILERFAPAAIRRGFDPSSIDWAYNFGYAIPHQQVEAPIDDPGVPVGWWRSVSASQNAYVVECFLDELAAAGGRDPLALRLELLAAKPRQRLAVETAGRMIDWSRPRLRGQGVGLALCECFDSIVAHAVEVAVTREGRLRVERVATAVDCGTTVDPDTVTQQMQSGIIFGLSAALYGRIEIAGGRVRQGNYDDYPVLRYPECPEIEVKILSAGTAPGGIGEPGLPPIAPAVVNAVAAATGKRVRRLPLKDQDLSWG